MVNTNKKNGKIGVGSFSARDAYNIVKDMATSQSWTPCDVYGNQIPNAEPYQYTGGTMPPSVAASIGKQSGILEGKIQHFENFELLQTYIKEQSFSKEHPSGTYIICDESHTHATIGKGVDKNGNVRYYDATTNGKYTSEKQTGSWTLIY